MCILHHSVPSSLPTLDCNQMPVVHIGQALLSEASEEQCILAPIGTLLSCHMLATPLPNSVHDLAETLLCSARASLPLNVDLEMTFPIKDGVQSYKPKFELPSGGQAEQSSADHQAAAGGFAIYLRCTRPSCRTAFNARLACNFRALLCDRCFSGNVFSWHL